MTPQRAEIRRPHADLQVDRGTAHLLAIASNARVRSGVERLRGVAPRDAPRAPSRPRPVRGRESEGRADRRASLPRGAGPPFYQGAAPRALWDGGVVRGRFVLGSP